MAVSAPVPKINVYIDGFNLYRGCLRGSRYRWLDLEAMCRQLFPSRSINRIRYFTAHIKGDPGASSRQDVYLRALSSLPKVHIHDDGIFATHTVIRPVSDQPHAGMQAVIEWLSGYDWRPLNRPAAGHHLRASVVDKKEKRSDVNLAAYLMLDAFQKDMDGAFVVSGDSDLVTPIRLVNTHAVRVGVVNPTSNRTSWDLLKAASSYSVLSSSILAASQLPDPVAVTPTEAVRKPQAW